MTHTNIKQRFTTRSDKLIALELQYRTKESMCNTISFQDRSQEIAGTIQEKGKVPGEEQDQKSGLSSACFASEIPDRN